MISRPATQAQASGPQPTPRLAAEQAITLALNDLRPVPGGYHLSHPRYTFDFTPQGLRLTPRQGGPVWRWQLDSVAGGQGETPLVPVTLAALRPTLESRPAGTVIYDRGGLREQYLLGPDYVEQQFILPEPLLPAGADLVISGRVSSQGELETTPKGWLWRTAEGVVSLGQVWVFDATGRQLPARLEVTASQTRLVVDGAALAGATYPVTIDPQIGTNDFRISDMGLDGNSDYDAFSPAVAYNPDNNEYLVVWEGDDNTSPLVDQEYEIFGQRLNAATGAEIGTDFQISDMGVNGNINYEARAPDIVYNPTTKQYLVVWQGDDTNPTPSDPESEIYGQFLNAAGAEIGTNDFRISQMGPEGDANFDALRPALAYNSTTNQYLVVWQGEETPTLAGAEAFEIYGQLLNASGGEVGPNDFRISDMGIDDSNHNIDAFNPALAYNASNNEYLVVWLGDDDTPPMADNQFEIYGQRIAANGTPVGTNDFRLSHTVPNSNYSPESSGPFSPAIAYNSANNEYLVVWVGASGNELEIYGQRLNAAASPVGPDDFRISDMGPNGNAGFAAFEPSLIYSPNVNQYLVAWQGDDNISPLVNDEFEIFGQWLAAGGTEVGANDFRLSEMGPDGNTNFGAFAPALAYNSTNNHYLVAWSGDNTTNDESEIYGQRYQRGNEIEVRGNNVIIVDGDATPSGADHTNFGNVTVLRALTRTFTIINQDLTPLNLTGSPRVSLSGPGAGAFTVATLPASSIDGGSSTTFQIRFNPVVTGTQAATVTIPNNDLDENPYDFAIQGTGTNLAPLANAGPDKKVGVGTVGTLDGTASNDPDGHLPLSYFWTQTGGPAVVLSSNTASQPTFNAPANLTVLTFTLRVTDALGLPAPGADEVVISITREAPVADAGPDQSLGATLNGILDGSGSFDPDGHVPLTYRWSQISGPAVVLSSNTISRPTFTAPNQATALVFSLTVTDNIGLPSLADQVTINITRQAPVADAGPDQTLDAGEDSSLDGSGSFDPDGHLPLSYRWSQTGGPAITLSSNTASQPTFTAPTQATVLTFTLRVTDTLGLGSSPDQVVITVEGGPGVYLPLLLR